MGVIEPTEVQREAIPRAMAGSSLAIQCYTGSGKVRTCSLCKPSHIAAPNQLSQSPFCSQASEICGLACRHWPTCSQCSPSHCGRQKPSLSSSLPWGKLTPQACCTWRLCFIVCLLSIPSHKKADSGLRVLEGLVGVPLVQAEGLVGVPLVQVEGLVGSHLCMLGSLADLVSYTCWQVVLKGVRCDIASDFHAYDASIHCALAGTLQAVVVAPSRELAMQIVRVGQAILPTEARGCVQQAIGGANPKRQVCGSQLPRCAASRFLDARQSAFHCWRQEMVQHANFH